MFFCWRKNQKLKSFSRLIFFLLIFISYPIQAEPLKKILLFLQIDESLKEIDPELENALQQELKKIETIHPLISKKKKVSQKIIDCMNKVSCIQKLMKKKRPMDL